MFGPNYGEDKGFTVEPPDYDARCPNVAKFASNLHFTTELENHLMIPIMNHQDPNQAATEWLKRNTPMLDQWLAGVTTFDGKPAL
ncbi:hypothetical protein NO135_22080, partial [Clostridioides difficile]|nr:hypothetical protein [Clostridioides difficile]